jgi:hypothetical protein
MFEIMFGTQEGQCCLATKISLSLRWPAENFLSDRLAELNVVFCLFSVLLSVGRIISRSVTMFAVGSSASIANN